MGFLLPPRPSDEDEEVNKAWQSVSDAQGAVIAPGAYANLTVGLQHLDKLKCAGFAATDIFYHTTNHPYKARHMTSYILGTPTNECQDQNPAHKPKDEQPEAAPLK